MRVDVRNNNVDRALKVLKRKLVDDGMFKELQANMYYEKPSEARNRRKRQAIARFKRDNAIRLVELNG